MPVYKWRKRPTKHFGEVWTPFVQIELRGRSGRYESLALPADSGAVVSLLRRSVADLLGIELESGRKIDLTGIGGARTDAYVHDISTRFGDGIELQVPFAIATSEKVPNLLGRLGVFDNLQVDFDATLEETRITVPWLGRDERRIYGKLLEIAEYVIERLPQHFKDQYVSEAITIFVNRAGQLFATACGLLKLRRVHDAPLVIRALFELATQFEYLMRDPSNRAQAYLDFTHITRYRQWQAIVKAPAGAISRHLAQSALRPEGEKRLKQEYDRVFPQFQKSGTRPWDAWYCKTFYGLASDVDRTGEYDFWYRLGSAHAHGDPFSVERQAALQSVMPVNLFIAALTYYVRILRPLTSSMILPAEYHEVFEELNKEFS